LSINEDALADGVYYFTYDGFDSDLDIHNPNINPGLGGFNIASVHFAIKYLDSDLPGTGRTIELTVKVWDGNGNTSTTSYTVTENTAQNSVLVFPALQGAADLTDIRAIQLKVQTQGDEIDARFDDFQVQCKEADLSLIKTVSDEYPQPGDVVTFTITLSNAGPEDATGVEVTDYVPSGYVTISNISNGGVFNGLDEIVWENLTVPAGSQVQLTFDAEVMTDCEFGCNQYYFMPGGETSLSSSSDDECFDNVADIGSADNDYDWDPDDEDDGDNAKVTPTATINGRVWEDADLDGIEDPSESGVANVTVQLLDNSNNVLQTTTTDASGYYSFSDVEPGYYKIKVIMPSGFDEFSPQDQGDDFEDSDVDPNTGETSLIEVNSCQEITDIDAGIYKLSKIGDFVWWDDNQDGIQDPGETGINGVTVKLLQNNTVIQTTTTANHPVTSEPGYYEFDGLEPGDYQVMFNTTTGYDFTVKDAGNDDSVDSDADPNNGMTDVISLGYAEENLDVDAGFVCTVSVDAGSDKEICQGSFTTLHASASNGKTPYSYEWSHGLGNNQTVVASPNVTTTYTVTVTDANGCTATDAVTVVVNDTPSVSFTKTDATCGESNGSATANPSGGTPPYSYLWSNGETTQTIDNLSSGTYTVTVTDDNGCTGVGSVYIQDLDGPTVTASASPDTICYGENSTLTATASGGTGQLTYEWSHGLGTGPQKVVSTTLSASASGGTPGYTYTWSHGLGVGQNKVVSPNVTTTYTVTVEDSEGCTATDEVTVVVHEKPTVVVSGENAKCGESNGSAWADPTGGTTPYSYE